jgi:hypothetical protein
MKLQDQVCTLAQAKRLKELGITQTALFYYFPDPNDTATRERLNLPEYCLFPGTYRFPNSDGDTLADECAAGRFKRVFAAFNVAELATMLPASYCEPWRLQIDKHDAKDGEDGGWQVGYIDNNNYSKHLSPIHASLAKALACTLIEALSNQDVETEEAIAGLTA